MKQICSFWSSLQSLQLKVKSVEGEVRFGIQGLKPVTGLMLSHYLKVDQRRSGFRKRLANMGKEWGWY